MNDSSALQELQRAAALALVIEVYEESPLCSTGSGFSTPWADPSDNHTDAVVGWPFASWVFSRWLEAGFVQLEPPALGKHLSQQEPPRWLAGIFIGESSRPTLSQEDSRELLANIERWSSRGVDGSIELVRSDATDDLEVSAWVDVLGSFEGAPEIGMDPFSASDLQYRIATTDMTPFQRNFTFVVPKERPRRLFGKRTKKRDTH